MQFLLQYHESVEQYMQQHLPAGEPVTLYEPISYLMGIGGKRIRPALLLMACEMMGGNREEAMPAAYAMEVFHNFTLMHDDIMDRAALRRGKATVHEKYDVNTAILSGDAMLIHCYDVLSAYQTDTALPLLKVFNKMALELCEGQRMDMDFEKSDNVTIADYLKMIEYKTSVLLACALQSGAIIAKASMEVQNHFYAFGINSGIAFQIQDDLLDAFGDADAVGKQNGGDILQGKKTYLYLKAMELSDEKQKSLLTKMYEPGSAVNDGEKVELVKKIFTDTGAREYAVQVRDAYNDLAKSHIAPLRMSEENKNILREFADFMAARKL